MLGLRWEDVGEESLTVKQAMARTYSGESYMDEPKTPSSVRTIHLSELDLASLRQHRAYQAEDRLLVGRHFEDNGLVFATNVGTPISPRNLYRQFTGLVKDAGLPVIRFHDLRHTHATMLLEASVHPKVVQERLGHSQISVVLDTYSHALPTMQKEATQKIDALLRRFVKDS